ncbi:PREDICTED: apoptosis-inducing factor 1, mitochondrial [Trachymyrmex cornetzi]|uniref:Putative apoptosis-inducing factor 1, mitochondrial n=1 Tax=Trachymyrmex cornetzi TaxID=471704 RepID=A0A151J8E8_9HYME|nr:PREDICTED: apoptosis-inducing factor 1, mitochondrial [Trachymyrmex cornetzi]KYN21118.1 Putative apoptosis-inducing factor 1, mitochondrial [Trachymyrmex cornetzi]
MFVCGRIVGQLPARLTHVNHLYRSVKYAGVVNISNLRHNSDASNKKPHKPSGTTVKPEECVSESKYLQSQKTIPVCETGAPCPAPQEKCKPNNKQIQLNEKGSGFRKNGKYQFSYWHLVAVLIVTGVAYKISSSFLKDDKTDQQKSQSKQKKEGRRHLRSKNKVKVPADSKLIPKEVPYLLIGGGTAAFSAFRSIKSRDPKAKVLVIAQEEEFPYMRPPLSKELWYNTDRDTTAQLRFNQWNGTQRSIFYEPREFYSNVTNLTESDKGGVAVAMGWKVTKIDVINKIVTLENDYEINYNKCLIATGTSPKHLPIFESAEDGIKDKVITFRTKDNFLDLEENVSNPKCKNVVVIGGGFLGSELACALARSYKSKNIFQIYKEKFIMAQVLPEYLSEWTTKKAEAEGVRTMSNTEVQDYKYKNGRLSLVLTGGQTIDADQVIVAVGVQPNTDLATTSNLETDPKIGGFLVNAELEARSNLWVAGDAACFYDVKLGRRRVEHHDHAVTSGRLAGENMTGAGKPYLHQSMFWSDLGPDVGYEAIGIVDSSLPTVGVFAKTTGANAMPVNLNDEQKINSEVSQSNEKSESSISQIVQNNNIEDNAEEKKKKVREDKVKSEQSMKYKDFEKGVVFYLRDDVVVGIVLWNIFNRMSLARQVLTGNTKYDDLNEVAKLFAIHED